MNTGAENATSDILRQAIERAQRLLAYASGKGLVVDEGTVKVIVGAHEAIATGPLSRDDEAAFWAGLGKLARVAAPVTPESLEDTDSALHDHGFFRSLATRWIATVSLLVILGTLTCQIYWVVIVSRIDSYKTADSQWTQTREAGYGASQSTGSTLPAGPDQLQDAKIALVATEELLAKMIFVSSKLSPSLADAGIRGKVVLEEAQNIADILYKLVLPALYGLLGSIIYALRIVSQQIQERSYTWSGRVAAIGRLLLGPVLGFASLVLVPNLPDNPTLKNLPPLAIALVAGYSVDLIFSLLDRIINAFRPEKTAQAPAQGP